MPKTMTIAVAVMVATAGNWLGGQAAVAATPEVRTAQVVVHKAIPHPTKIRKTATLSRLETKTVQAGRAGVRTITYRVSYLGSTVTSRLQLSSVVTKAAVPRVILKGTAAPKLGPAPKVAKATKNLCRASYYASGSRTASGERFKPNGYSAAHRKLKFGTRLKVTNAKNGRTVIIKINDRGPYSGHRCLDLSKGAMKYLKGLSSGVIKVKWEKV